MEPTSASRFENVDRHILRVALETAFRGTTGQTAAKNKAAFKANVARVVDALGLDASTAQRWVEFLCRETAPDDLTLMKYSQMPPSVARETHLSVFSRAALLLRLASGSALELVTEVGFTADDVKFWWGAVGTSRGMWDGVRTAGSIIDLWADIEPILKGVDAFQTRVLPADQTFFRAASEVLPDISGLGSCERIALWSLTPG
jgi:hypothetical protein